MTTVNVIVNGRDKDIPIAITLPSTNDQSITSSRASKPSVGVLLSHGAGGDMHSGNLPAFAQAFGELGFPCLRFTCKGPLTHRVAVAHELLSKVETNIPGFPRCRSWIVAGHSMGGRVAAQLAADLPDRILACVLFSYPLHPPGSPKELRDAPLIALDLPILFVRGTKDPFSEDKVWKDTMKRMRSGVEICTVEGGDHGLQISGSIDAKKKVLDGVLDAMKAFTMKVRAFNEKKVPSKKRKAVAAHAKQQPSTVEPKKMKMKKAKALSS